MSTFFIVLPSDHACMVSQFSPSITLDCARHFETSYILGKMYAGLAESYIDHEKNEAKTHPFHLQMVLKSQMEQCSQNIED